MQLAHAINQVLDLKPGYEYTHEQVLGWLNECEQLIWLQLISLYEQDEHPVMPAYDASTNEATQLMVPDPYSKLYIYYLAAQMSYFNREVTDYINSKEQYTNLLNAFTAQYMRSHKRKNNQPIKGVL